ncbi:MAG TPA: 4-hydroxy-tetrahydrodipicolinate reductase [Terriglobales bacterium]|nr:4-hydroxy-tetrahydrodipicolinate reductase [Terriglobales bacterium]
MHLLILGRGKTGSLVSEVARERRHKVEIIGASDNREAAGLNDARLQACNVVIDFTTPEAALSNMRACIAAGKTMVVGTTGWYRELPAIRALVEKSGVGFLYAANFSVGVNLFFDLARVAAQALTHEYHGQIFERHHATKKDAPSGTALAMQQIIRQSAGQELEITSFREGEVVGLHELVFESPNDRIYLCHDATSRRGFAEGAVRAAEWLVGKKGFFEFKDVWRDL